MPDRVVELPTLPDVHVAFASSTLCGECAAAAAAGDVDALTRRGLDGWIADDSGAVPDLVRLVLANAGHQPPPRHLPPPEFRQPSPAPLSAEDAVIWAGLEPLIYDGPEDEVVVRGRIEHEVGGQRTIVLVHRAGTRSRLADENGTPWLLTDGDTMWRRRDGGMVAEPHQGDAWADNGSDLAGRRSREETDLFGFGQPIGPITRTEFLGRAAWRFAFAAPAHKPYDMHVVVDADTGLVLEQRFGDSSVARWTEFVTDERVDPALFRWDGPSTTVDALRAAGQREHDADMAARAAWFAEHVTAQPLSTAGEGVEVMLHDWDSDGGFQAWLDGGLSGSLARRPRSGAWWPLEWSDVTHRWSDEQWDWALSIWDEDESTSFDAAAVADLARRLGDGWPGDQSQRGSR